MWAVARGNDTPFLNFKESILSKCLTFSADAYQVNSFASNEVQSFLHVVHFMYPHFTRL